MTWNRQKIKPILYRNTLFKLHHFHEGFNKKSLTKTIILATVSRHSRYNTIIFFLELDLFLFLECTISLKIVVLYGYIKRSKMNKPKIIMGIDPGSNLLGYAFIQVIGKKKPRVISMGVLDMRKHDNHSQKLAHIFTELQKLVVLYEPTDAAIEAPFYSKNVQSMLKLGRAQGVAMVALSEKGFIVEEYSPKSIKRAVTGNGNASKEQVASMLPHVVEGELSNRSLDATDALGVAFCHHIQIQGVGLGQKKHTDWNSFLKDNPNRKAKL